MDQQVRNEDHRPLGVFQVVFRWDHLEWFGHENVPGGAYLGPPGTVVLTESVSTLQKNDRVLTKKAKNASTLRKFDRVLTV